MVVDRGEGGWYCAFSRNQESRGEEAHSLRVFVSLVCVYGMNVCGFLVFFVFLVFYVRVICFFFSCPLFR